jgi:hypothetical protein
MKNQIILLLSALVITFLTGYIESVTDADYPITGTFGINGQKVSYKLDKTHFGDSPFEVMIISDVSGLNGYIRWRESGDWQLSKMNQKNNILLGSISNLKPISEIEYQVILNKEDKNYTIPENQPVRLKIFGKIPSFVSTLYILLLYAGLFLSIRTGLEVFNKGKDLKKYSFVQSAVLLLLALLISPLYISYKLNAINHNVLPFLTMFDLRISLLSIASILSAVIFFNSKNNKVLPLISSIIIILIFILLR